MHPAKVPLPSLRLKEKESRVMSPSAAHQLRNILAVILGSIEIGDLKVAKQAVHQAESCIESYEQTNGLKPAGSAPAPQLAKHYS